MPMLQKEVVEKYKWATQQEIMDFYALGQCTPGIIACNTATFVGYQIKGIWGAIAAVLGVATPSLVIITIIAMFLEGFTDIPAVINAFAGIRIAVSALITSSVISLYKTSIIDKITMLIFVTVFVVSVFTSFSPILVVILAGICGVAAKRLGGKA